MKVVLKTRSQLPLKTILAILILSLGSAYYYMDQPDKTNVRATMMTASPIVPEIPLMKTEPALDLRQVTISRNETFSQLMQSQGFSADVIQQVYETAREYYNLAQIHAGKKISISTAAGQFQTLEYDIDPLQTLIVKNEDGMMKADMIQRTTEVRVEQLGGYIEGSLYASMNRLGEGDELVIRFADIFEWDVDFFKDLQQGDAFRIVFERNYLEGEPFGYGKILAAELINKGNAYTAIGYQRGKHYEYFSPDGKAMRKAFLASPMKFSRVSSGFTARRYHPVLKKYRPHYGIDYAAPHGTPVRSIGRGTVILAGWAGGAGKTVKIQHNKEIATVYCHLSRFASGVRQGATVSQGQVIGYVGSTGLATGPHLDFRYLKNGKYVNFLKIKAPQDEPLSAAELKAFRAASSAMAEQLAAVDLVDSAPQVANAASGTYEINEAIR